MNGWCTVRIILPPRLVVHGVMGVCILVLVGHRAVEAMDFSGRVRVEKHLSRQRITGFFHQSNFRF